MRKRRTVLIFISGTAFGFFLAPVLLYAVDSVDRWLPYTRPDLATVETIEKMASRQLEPMTKKVLRLNEYRRWYVQGRESGRDVIWGEWDQNGKPGLTLGHRRFPPNPAAMLDGGCGRVELIYDVKHATLERYTCNPVP